METGCGASKGPNKFKLEQQSSFLSSQDKKWLLSAFLRLYKVYYLLVAELYHDYMRNVLRQRGL